MEREGAEAPAGDHARARTVVRGRWTQAVVAHGRPGEPRTHRPGEVARCDDSVGSIRVGSREHTDHGDSAKLRIEPVDDPVRSSAGAVSVGQWGTKSLPHTLRVVEQGSDDELERRDCDCLGQVLGKLPTSRWGNDQLVAGVGHRCRARIAARSVSSLSPSPAASSISASVSARTTLLSESTAMVSSRLSRSSTATSTAVGRPCTVTVTRSCWAPTCATSSDRWALTSARERVSDMVISMTIFVTEVNRDTSESPTAGLMDASPR